MFLARLTLLAKTLLISLELGEQIRVGPDEELGRCRRTERLGEFPNVINELGLRDPPISLPIGNILEGQAELRTESSTTEVNKDHFLLLPNGVNSKITSTDGAVVFRAIVPGASRFDPSWGETASALRCVDWTNEPVLNSEFDARKRIYMLTPKLSGTKVAKGEMIIYPPETMASNHHHEGAEHFQVILKGSATFHLNEQPHKVKSGDTIYIYDNERHFIINDSDNELAFIEYFVPGTYKTVWAENAPICTWNPSGVNIKGGKPNREIGSHSSAEAHNRQDL